MTISAAIGVAAMVVVDGGTRVVEVADAFIALTAGMVDVGVDVGRVSVDVEGGRSAAGLFGMSLMRAGRTNCMSFVTLVRSRCINRNCDDRTDDLFIPNTMGVDSSSTLMIWKAFSEGLLIIHNLSRVRAIVNATNRLPATPVNMPLPETFSYTCLDVIFRRG